MAITIAYDKEVQGWTSEYSYILDSGVSLNNNYYSFKNGRIWRHNAENVNRNTFYDLYSPTEMVFIFNEAPSSIKNFKTINFEGNGLWSVGLSTDLDETGTIEPEWFKTKEGKHFAWIRGQAKFEEPDLESSTVGGIGVVDSITDSLQFNFSSIPSAVSIGDAVYFSEIVEGAGNAPNIAGIIESIDSTSITLTHTGVPQDLQPIGTPVSGDFLFYSKDASVETSGIIGFYNVVTMTNNEATAAELFAVSSEVHAHRT